MSASEPLGLLGGTFDPVHRGHLELADKIRDLLRLPRFLLLPTAVPPHKSLRSLSPIAHRLEMLRLALRERPGLEICGLELDPERTCYTIDTLRILRDGPNPCRPLFVMGMDALLQLRTWREADALMREFDLIAIDRTDRELRRVRDRLDPDVASRIISPEGGPRGLDERRLEQLELGRGGRIIHLALPLVPVSSSVIRARAAAGRSLHDLVPAAVAGYIQRTGLYRQEDRS